MSRPRVLLDALLVRERPTGVGRAILELTRALAAADRGCDFTVAVTAPDMFAHLEGRPDWSLAACPGARGGTLRKAWFTQTGLPRLVRRCGADLLHSMHFVAPLRPGCPSVVTVCDLAYLRHPETVEQPRRTYYRLFVPPSLRRAAAVLGISESTSAEVRRLLPEVAPRVSTTAFATPSWVWRARAGESGPPPARRRRFLFVGTLEPRKNLERLLEAYARARREMGPDLPSLLLVGGRGWRDSVLRRRMEALRGEGGLEVRDYCDQATLWRLYRSSLALLFPSRYEGFGFPILEAMAAGLPVLTADRGATAEVGGDAALLVDPDDTAALAAALVRLAADEGLRAGLARAGAERARTWNWERTAEATATVYRRLLTAADRFP